MSDDTADVTLGMLIHGSVGLLVLLFFLEARAGSRRADRGAPQVDPKHAPDWQFHPDLLVRWDDEYAYSPLPPSGWDPHPQSSMRAPQRRHHVRCDRGPVSAWRTSRRRRSWVGTAESATSESN